MGDQGYPGVGMFVADVTNVAVVAVVSNVATVIISHETSIRSCPGFVSTNYNGEFQVCSIMSATYQSEEPNRYSIASLR
jgi:hypothetical protein